MSTTPVGRRHPSLRAEIVGQSPSLVMGFHTQVVVCTLLLLTTRHGLPAGADTLRVQTFRPNNWTPLPTGDCRPCASIFGKLEVSPDGGGKMFQHVDIQERGEPKSGTGFMYEWATASLAQSCIYLQRAYGRGSCRIEWTFQNRTLIFEPHLAGNDNDKPCHCSTIDRREYKGGTLLTLSKTVLFFLVINHYSNPEYS